jgi:uncharacterized protein (TIGR02453 family)
MAFQGWTGDFIGFFRGLELDNSKSYFEAHRKQYERDVKGPMEALLADIAAEVGPGRMFRINRDIRFSADKSPYKTNLGAVAGELYIHLDARRFFIGTGAHMPDTKWLGRFREAVAGPPGARFDRIVGGLREAGLNVGGNPLKTAPKGYPADHPRIEYLRWREVTAGRSWPIEPWIATPGAKDRILETWAHLKPFSSWLTANVPSE